MPGRKNTNSCSMERQKGGRQSPGNECPLQKYFIEAGLLCSVSPANYGSSVGDTFVSQRGKVTFLKHQGQTAADVHETQSQLPTECRACSPAPIHTFFTTLPTQFPDHLRLLCVNVHTLYGPPALAQVHFSPLSLLPRCSVKSPSSEAAQLICSSFIQRLGKSLFSSQQLIYDTGKDIDTGTK